MFLILKENEKIIKTIPVQNNLFDQISFGCDKVKEISIINTISNSNEIKLKNLYEELRSIDYKKINEVIVFYNKNTFYSFKTFIKEIYYRTLNYMRCQDLEMQENLSIRFIDDNLYVYNKDKNIVTCDKKCPYFSFDFCNKYHEPILQNDLKENLICRKCFLEAELNIKYECFDIVYDNMKRIFNQEGEQL